MRRKDESKIDLRALFESGERLDFAWVEFSRFFDRFALRALNMDPINDEDLIAEDPDRYAQLSRGWLPRTFETRQLKLKMRTRDELL